METRNHSFFSENKHLLFLSIFNFLFIYLSSFVKGYGYFIDEFYYIACANRPALGYVDHPPFAPLLLSIYQIIFGNSIYSIRFLPAVVGSLSVFYIGIIAKEMGGGRFAQVLSACMMITAPVFAVISSFYSMNAFEPLFAILCLYFIIKMIKENDPKKWIAIGILFGLGMMNKHTFGLFIIFIIVSLILTGKWKLIFTKWFVFGSLIAFIIFLPNIIWQIQNGYPSVEFYQVATTYKNIYTPPIKILKGQIIITSFTSFPIWTCGIIYLLILKSQNNFKFLSIFFILSLIFMLIIGSSRPDRISFAYPGIFAGGSIFFEKIILKYKLKLLKIVLIAFVFAGLIISLPLILPYFTYEQIADYVQKIGLNTQMERGNKPLLPQLIADRIGWEEKVNLIATAYNKLNENEKKNSIIASPNYGNAGAIELYGKKYNLPPVVSGQNTYYLWSKNLLEKGDLKPEIIINLSKAENYEKLKNQFEIVEPCEGEFINQYVSDHENELKVFICSKPKLPLSELLEKSKFYY